MEGKGLDGLEAQREREADAFARRALIPKSGLLRVFVKGAVSHAQVESVAQQLGIAQGIPVGRLQHDGVIPFSHLDGLTGRYAWTEMRGQ